MLTHSSSLRTRVTRLQAGLDYPHEGTEAVVGTRETRGASAGGSFAALRGAAAAAHRVGRRSALQRLCSRAVAAARRRPPRLPPPQLAPPVSSAARPDTPRVASSSRAVSVAVAPSPSAGGSCAGDGGQSRRCTRLATLCARVVHGEMWVLGGIGGIGDTFQYLATAEAYSQQTNSWRMLPDLSQRRRGAACGIVGGSLVVAGGRSRGVGRLQPSDRAMDPAPADSARYQRRRGVRAERAALRGGRRGL